MTAQPIPGPRRLIGERGDARISTRLQNHSIHVTAVHPAPRDACGESSRALIREQRAEQHRPEHVAPYRMFCHFDLLGICCQSVGPAVQRFDVRCEVLGYHVPAHLECRGELAGSLGKVGAEDPEPAD